ncbi:hypothetical protein [Carboxydothermus pertinax]|uniref:Uncharacterized protein n=1 Tax=Carboxydothermus pertinax TaxID=870242 RepID=A0A1L8CYE6_9THEO|nr:hypothetical protein [Carboxydothermus pertinax]GAV23917.1 hypothetical protein cpu_24270 [Carboxydothermus pertinax]
MSWLNNVEYNAKRLGYATLQGVKDVVNSNLNPMTWTPKEAAKNIALEGVGRYSNAVGTLIKEGAVVSKAAKLLSYASPALTVYNLVSNTITFGKGFYNGWQAYGVNHR